MKLKSTKLNFNLFVVLGLLLFFFLLRHNQIFFQYGSLYLQTHKFTIHSHLNFFDKIKDYYRLYFERINFSEIFIYLFLLFPGYSLIKSKVNFTNISIFLLYLFFFAPFIIFFLNYDNIFYQIISAKKIAVSQFDLINVSIALYINLILLIFLSKLNFKFKFNFYSVRSHNLKLICLGFIVFLLVLFFFKINSISGENNNFYTSLEYFNYRVIITGFFGYLYFLGIYIFLPLYYLLDNKNIGKFFVIFIYLFFYIFFQTKINIFIILFLIFNKKLLHSPKNFYLNILKIILIFLVAALFLSFCLDHFFQIKTSLYFERFFYLNQKTYFFY